MDKTQVLTDKTQDLILKLLEENFVIYAKSARIRTETLENLIIFLLKEENTKELREVIRYCLYLENIDIRNYSGLPYYRGVTFNPQNLTLPTELIDQLASEQPQPSLMPEMMRELFTTCNYSPPEGPARRYWAHGKQYQS